MFSRVKNRWFGTCICRLRRRGTVERLRCQTDNFCGCNKNTRLANCFVRKKSWPWKKKKKTLGNIYWITFARIKKKNVREKRENCSTNLNQSQGKEVTISGQISKQVIGKRKLSLGEYKTNVSSHTCPWSMSRLSTQEKKNATKCKRQLIQVDDSFSLRKYTS